MEPPVLSNDHLFLVTLSAVDTHMQTNKNQAASHKRIVLFRLLVRFPFKIRKYQVQCAHSFYSVPEFVRISVHVVHTFSNMAWNHQWFNTTWSLALHQLRKEIKPALKGRESEKQDKRVNRWSRQSGKEEGKRRQSVMSNWKRACRKSVWGDSSLV